MKVDTYSPNTGEKLCTFALSPIVVENHRVVRKWKYILRFEKYTICFVNGLSPEAEGADIRIVRVLECVRHHFTGNRQSQITKQSIYFTNLSIYFHFPWASVHQYTVRATAIFTFRKFCPRGLNPVAILSHNIFRDCYSYGILSCLVLILGDFVLGDFILGDFVQKLFCPRGLCPRGL